MMEDNRENMDDALKKKSLDRKANIALLTAFVLMGAVLIMLHLHYKNFRGDGSRGGGPPPPNMTMPGQPPPGEQPPEMPPGHPHPGEEPQPGISHTPGTGPPPPPLTPGSGETPGHSHDGQGQLGIKPGFGGGLDQRELDRLTLQEGKFDEARENVKEYLQKSSNNFYATMQMGLIYKYQGHLEKSLEYFQQAHRLNPGDAFNTQQIGEVYIIIEPEKAIRLYERNLSKESERMDLHLAAVRAYHQYCVAVPDVNDRMKKTKIEESSKILKEIQKQKPDNIPASLIDLLNGHNLYLMGKESQAIRYYKNIPTGEKFVGNITEKFEAFTALGMIYLAQGDAVEARDYFQKALVTLGQWNDLRVERTFPRREEISLVLYTLFDLPDFMRILESYNQESVKFKEMGITPLSDSEEIRLLIYSMEKNRSGGHYKEAEEIADKLMKALEHQKGQFYDIGLLKPLFGGCLRLYAGDLHIKTGNTDKARQMYKEAGNIFKPLKTYGDDRIKMIDR